jgi:RimJ/RimL family protein N-acetyltransferase
MPARLTDLRRLLGDLNADDLDALDPGFGDWMRRPLGRETLASVVLPTSGSAYISLYNLNPSGLILLERGEIAAHVRALAVAPDMRNRGLAQTMLMQVEPIARERGLTWLWMTVAHDNAGATRCALRGGFKRYRPQVLRRDRAGLRLQRNSEVRLEVLQAAEVLEESSRWVVYETNIGDAWCAELAQADLLRWLTPHEGDVYRCLRGGVEIGLAHAHWLGRDQLHIDLWLEREWWGGPIETQALKAVLDQVQRVPSVIEVELGSFEHLKTAAGLFKTLGFEPVMHDRVWFVKQIGDSEATPASDGDEQSTGWRMENQTDS